MTLVERLRKLEGSDDHPEHRCERCGGRNIHSWYADNDVWNRVAGEYSVLCPICLSELVAEAGLRVTWRLSIESDDPELTKVRLQLHERLEEAAGLHWELVQAKARIAELEHQADCYWYDIASGEWAIDHCKDCDRLRKAVEAAGKMEKA